MNFVEDHEEWRQCAQEDGVIKTARDLRQLFSFILVSRGQHNATTFWNEYKHLMTDDFKVHSDDPNTAEEMCLYEIQQILRHHKFRLEDFSLGTPADPSEYFDETMYLHDKLEVIKMNDDVARLNVRQREIYEKVMKAVNDDNCEERLFYIGGPSGTGKTYLCNVIIRQLKSTGVNVLPVAWTGVAASLLVKGRTCHSTFKLPTGSMDDKTTCGKVDGIENVKCVIWDEIALAQKYALQAVDRKFREVSGNSKPFGNRVILVCGDFRKSLPILTNASRTEIVQASLKRSALWPSFKKYSLDVNMRIDSDEAAAFAEWLMEIANGKHIALPSDEIMRNDDCVKLPSEEMISDNLIEEIFPTRDGIDYSDRAILTLSNEEAVEISSQVLQQVGGDVMIYRSDDNGIFDGLDNPSELPPNALHLKVGALVMLVRNMNTAKGLCNGARLRVDKMLRNTLILTQLTGTYAGDKVVLPRITLSRYSPSNNFTRRQFPIRLSYAMTIDKSHGLTFKKLGINLTEPVFGHGQLYSSCSKVTIPENLHIKLPQFYDRDIIENIVYPEVLDE